MRSNFYNILIIHPFYYADDSLELNYGCVLCVLSGETEMRRGNCGKGI